MSITTYANLQTAIANWLHRGDLTATIPDFVALGEAQLNRAIRAPEMATATTLALTTAARFAALPTRFLEALSLSWDGLPLIQLSVDPVTLAAGINGAGRPESYALTHRFEFDRVPDTAYTLDLVYVKGLDLATDATNWLLSRHPDAYLFAALVEGAAFLGISDARLAAWVMRRDAAIATANAAESGRHARALRNDDLTRLSHTRAFNINKD